MANGSGNIYKPLDPDRNEIRILRLKPRQYNRDNKQDEHRIVCSLEHRTLDHTVEYTALSYVWENGFGPQDILISGIEHSASANLVDALRQLRNDDDDLVLWVDQLCINQDDYAEKASQIQKMSSIYEKAKTVVAWLGVSADESDLVFATLRQIDRHHALSLKAGILSDVARELEQTTSNSNNQIFNATSILDALRTAIIAFAARRYWGRLWVLQEFVLATDVLIMCGSKYITDVSLENAWAILRKTTSKSDDIDLVAISRAWQSSPLWWDSWLAVNRFISQRHDYHILRVRQTPRPMMEQVMFTIMYEILTTFSGQIQLACSDPRDRVFSLLGMAGDAEKFGHFPDYTKSIESIYEEVARVFLQLGYVDTLSFCQEDPNFKARNMASWAPDWSLKIRIPLWGKLPVNTSRGWSIDLAASILDSETIAVSGTCVDTVRSHGSRWPHGRPMTSRQMQIYLRELREFVDRSDLILADIKELVCAYLAAPAAILYLKGKDEMLNQYRALSDQQRDFSDLDDELDPELEVQCSTGYKRELLNQLLKCPFITVDGYVGIAPPYIQEGDCICIFPGSRAPYVLREQLESNKFKVIGAAHVHGLMKGEYFETKPDVRRFKLV